MSAWTAQRTSRVYPIGVMALDPARLVEHVHGHLGWLAAAALLHPAIVLRRRGRRAHLAVVLSTGFITTAAAVGVWLYVAYRQRLKQAIFREGATYGWLFERKEHLAFGAVVLAWAGTVAYFASRRASVPLAGSLQTFAFRAFVCAAALAITVAVLGTTVAIFRTF